MDTNIVGALFAAVLLLARMLPIVELTPFLSGPWIPRTVRIGVAVGLSLLVAPLAVPPELVVRPPGLVEGTLLLGRELAIGLGIGFLTSLVFEGARMAGGIVDRSLLPADTREDGPVARLYVLLAVALFFVLGGPRLWVAGLARSYAVFGLDASVGITSALGLGRAVGDAIGLAVLLALPVLGVLLLAELLQAVAARSSHVVRDGMPVASTRSLVIVAAVALSLVPLTDVLGDAIIDAMSSLPQALEALDVR